MVPLQPKETPGKNQEESASRGVRTLHAVSLTKASTTWLVEFVHKESTFLSYHEAGVTLKARQMLSALSPICEGHCCLCIDRVCVVGELSNVNAHLACKFNLVDYGHAPFSGDRQVVHSHLWTFRDAHNDGPFARSDAEVMLLLTDECHWALNLSHLRQDSSSKEACPFLMLNLYPPARRRRVKASARKAGMQLPREMAQTRTPRLLMRIPATHFATFPVTVGHLSLCPPASSNLLKSSSSQRSKCLPNSLV